MLSKIRELHPPERAAWDQGLSRHQPCCVSSNLMALVSLFCFGFRRRLRQPSCSFLSVYRSHSTASDVLRELFKSIESALCCQQLFMLTEAARLELARHCSLLPSRHMYSCGRLFSCAQHQISNHRYASTTGAEPFAPSIHCSSLGLDSVGPTLKAYDFGQTLGLRFVLLLIPADHFRQPVSREAHLQLLYCTATCCRVQLSELSRLLSGCFAPSSLATS